MSSSRRYTSSGSSGYTGKRPGRDRSKPVTDLRSKREDQDSSLQHAALVEDSIVDACCDHAHAVARVHGAPEVMLEHLVHALARVPEAAEVLEQMGYDVDHIRRESAAVIASDIPVGKHDPKRQLYASNDFNTVLHLAAANASRQGEAEISVWELVEAISSFDETVPAVQLLNEGLVSNQEQTLGGFDDSRGRRSTRRTSARPERAQRLSAMNLGATAGSDELLQQGLEAIEQAVRQRAGMQTPSDAGVEEIMSAFENRIGAHIERSNAEMKELREMVAKIGDQGGNEQSSALHADLIALRDAVEKRDSEFTDVSRNLEQRLDTLKDDVGTLVSDPQSGLRDEIRALADLVETKGAGRNDDKLANSMEARLVSMESAFDTRQNEILGFHSTLGKGVDEQGTMLHRLETRLKHEHDDTQGELNSIREFLEKLAKTIDQQGQEINRVRLDHIGDMSVIGNKLDDISSHIGGLEKTAGQNLKAVHAFKHRASGVKDRPARAGTTPKRSPSQNAPATAKKSFFTAGAPQPGEAGKKRLVIEAEDNTQRVARRFATRGDEDAAGSGEQEHPAQMFYENDAAGAYSGNQVRRRRSARSGSRTGWRGNHRIESLRERLAHRGSQIKNAYRARVGAGARKSEPHPSEPPGWGRRFWNDVKGLFRDDDPRWTDWRE